MSNAFKYLLLRILLLYHTKMNFKNAYSHFGPRLKETLIVTEESFEGGRNWLDRLPHYSLTHMPTHWLAKIYALCDMYKTTHSHTKWNIRNDSHQTIHSRTQTFLLLFTDWLADLLKTNSFSRNVWTLILCIVMLENSLKPSVFVILSNTNGCEFKSISFIFVFRMTPSMTFIDWT